MKALLIADHDNNHLSEQTAKALSAASQLGAVDVLIMGHDCTEVASQAACLSGVGRVLLAEHEALKHQLAEPCAEAILSIASEYQAIVSAASTTGKGVLPRIAAKLDVMQISEVIEILDEKTFKRPTYAGNAIQTVQSNDSIKVLTIRTANFATTENAPTSAEVVALDITLGQQRSVHISDKVSDSERPELQSAKVIVSGGRALGSQENFNATILPVADKLGAAVGASRAAVDSGFAPNDWQVGQTGKIVSPDLYVACGISGAIQHLAGMKDSKVIVAINNDEDAPIFQIADYRLEADLFEALPEITRLLS
ncbi:electron transfer flavoprotein subunit alpha/FixB family protein [Marinomonas piezotolerans]|uniref:Electron transfer flavoprotein subunit alpha n=1 Tax=Marinomonas piezotolerans TaxID=2213058 RepID=A0A370U7L8_9GAMM|nr:electron transfer flavoprotein subunit alpha/FixB family protein [Marinomonas piezotolerans]RDL43743.1 electron transfer flavoprotein subunit alpha/FixB family protein [Marinomonas piezotolerans]